MEIFEYAHWQDRYWYDVTISHRFKYAVCVRSMLIHQAVNAFVTIYSGYDSQVWTYTQARGPGDLNIFYVQDLDWPAIGKLHGFDMKEMVTGILVNPRFV